MPRKPRAQWPDRPQMQLLRFEILRERRFNFLGCREFTLCRLVQAAINADKLFRRRMIGTLRQLRLDLARKLLKLVLSVFRPGSGAFKKVEERLIHKRTITIFRSFAYRRSGNYP